VAYTKLGGGNTDEILSSQRRVDYALVSNSLKWERRRMKGKRTPLLREHRKWGAQGKNKRHS
jgi:hypothetical protein